MTTPRKPAKRKPWRRGFCTCGHEKAEHQGPVSGATYCWHHYPSGHICRCCAYTSSITLPKTRRKP